MPTPRSAKKSAPRKKPSSPGRAKKSKPTASKARKAAAAPAGGFPKALATLLRSRSLVVPSGLLTSPREAYAAQTAEFVETLAKLDDAELLAHAERVAGYAQRLRERANASWESSPLIREIRRRGLKEPAAPGRVVAIAFSLKRPLSEWPDRELLAAAKEWSRRGKSAR